MSIVSEGDGTSASKAATGTERSTSVLSFQGEVDMVSGEHFATHLHAALTTGVELLVIDMLRVDFLGSAGLAALVRFHTEAARRGIDVRLVCGRAARRTIELTGLADRFTPADTLSAALGPGRAQDPPHSAQ
ncbi:STAS domain-containing protein [Kibdelosporangium phytohabitans]|uniref:Anti-sigma factor antagonist n=1 Tax=Kibdelosporangium phytohabitans TaxID=860235 RepID=A0A0N7F3X1_9PSEU|nr:STAS domain-containing protein [Kibdelosporangium phytohabitans]ALG09815.1 hypothetical protein AOZ06_25565 [Kibdelosporangium phytohabitans]MBE1468797.1 anti-anti-sigma factor [Kibdelosporangium phytohabitans]